MSVFPARTEPSQMMASCFLADGCFHHVNTFICLFENGVNLNTFPFDFLDVFMIVTPHFIHFAFQCLDESVIVQLIRFVFSSETIKLHFQFLKT